MKIIVPQNYHLYTVIAIDPGLTHTGLAVFVIDAQSNTISRIEAHTLTNQKLQDHTGIDLHYHEERTLKLLKLSEEVSHYLNHYRPVYVACEAPFYNRFMPMAYGALTEVVAYIHMAVLNYSNTTPFIKLAPLSVKKYIGAKSVKNDTVKGKEVVKIAVSQIPEIMNVLQNDLNELTEHAIDAVAVGYCFLKQGEWL